MGYEPTKWCPGCSRNVYFTDFYVRSDDRVHNLCKSCHKAKSTARAQSVLGDQMIRAAKHRAAKKLLQYDLDGHRDEIAERISRGCELTGLPFTVTGPRNWDSPSVDRVKPELGYVYSNIRIIVWGLNSAFGYWGEEAAEKFVRAWLDKRNEM